MSARQWIEIDSYIENCWDALQYYLKLFLGVNCLKTERWESLEA